MTKAGRPACSVDVFQRRRMRERLCWASSPGHPVSSFLFDSELQNWGISAGNGKLEGCTFAALWKLLCSEKRKLKDYRGPPGAFPCKGHTSSKGRNAFLRRYKPL